MDNGGSGSGTSTDNGSSGGGTDARQIEPDSDEAIYGVLPQQSETDSGETERINGPRIGEDGKVYPFDPEDDETLQLAPQEDDSAKQAGDALIALLETLFGGSVKED